MTVEPAEHRTSAREFRRHAGGDAWGWKLGISQKTRGKGRDGAQKHRGGRETEREREESYLCCSALHYYLLEPEDEPAIVPERKGEGSRISLFMHSICLILRDSGGGEQLLCRIKGTRRR